MDAISYLLERKWPPVRKVALWLLFGTVLSWANFRLTEIVPSLFPGLFDSGLLGFLWGCLALAAGLLAIGTCLGVTLLVPLYAVYRITNTLHAWTRQRAIEEMVCAGLTGSAILDRMVGFGARWWLLACLPSILASVLLFPGLRDPSMLLLALGYLVGGAVIAYLGLYWKAWSGLASGEVKMPLLGSALIVQGVPVMGLMLGGLSTLSLLVSSLYVIVVARWAAIYALQNGEALSQMDTRIRRALRLKRQPSSLSGLSENPIVARQAMRGMDSADLISRGLTVVSFILTTIVAVEAQAPWLFAFLIGGVVLLNSYRAAGKMSQIITEEMESSTLETVRSAPISSDEFLKGWLSCVLRTQWIDSGVLVVSVVAVLVAMGEAALLANSLVVMGVCLCLVLPLAGAYIGASIAGQGKSRAQISGQLQLAFGSVAVVGGPQMMATTATVSLPVSMVVLTLGTVGFCWLLNAGAKKSLNRVFLPQK